MCPIRLLAVVILLECKQAMILKHHRHRWMKRISDDFGITDFDRNHHDVPTLNDDNNLLNKLNFNKTIKNLTMEYRIKNLLDLLPQKVAVSKEEAKKKKIKLEKEFEGKRKQLQGNIDCPTSPMSSKLRKSLRKYINKTMHHGKTNCITNNKYENVDNIKGSESTFKSKCGTNEVKSFTCTPTFQTQSLGERYYPSEFIHERCSECTQCMYGSGKCKQHSINVMVYYDADGVGMEKLYTWEERMFTVYTGCTCLVTSDNTIITILDHICGQLGGDPVRDPIHCFHGIQLFQTSYKESWAVP